LAPETVKAAGGHSAPAAGVELFDDLGAIAEVEDGALADDRQPSLFDRLSWYRLLNAYAPPSGKLLAARSGETWLFLAAEGACARAYANWYTLRFAAPGAEPEALRLIAESLRGRSPRLSRVELGPLAQDDPLIHAFRTAGWLTFVEESTVNWQIDTTGLSFEDYWAARPSRLRNTAKRKGKAAALDINIYNNFDPKAWKAYEAIYRASWKPGEGSPDFLKALAQQQGARGALRLGIARKDGHAIAAQLWLVEHGHATIHKLAYDDAARDLSPGTLLSVEMFRHVLDRDRVTMIDFGTGNDPYKAEWMDRCEPLQRMIAFNPFSPAGMAGAARAAASRLVRSARRQ
jgi:Acetyltransferase (GNAT) domain